ncbi:glycosyltransferase [Paenibacillus spiritus]|uniref:Glycosyltransferase n=1 Tax=Paenibacillus spiritus TaxID=2496557 RepID=A0A5J5FUX1_9BACL|nr:MULTISPECIES: glycosyltransferase [Paenibacillus]KAA8997554.1 glycosyltransferase [Paenibacillus spiritus]
MPRKTKLLFVLNSLVCGGAEKSLISLLQVLDESKYEVDLLLLRHQGIFMDQIPPYVRLLKEPRNYQLFDMPIRSALRRCVSQGRPGLALARVQAGRLFRREGNPGVREQRLWTYAGQALEKLPGEYDAAIGFMENAPLYYVIEKTKAARKIGFIHNDYDHLGGDPAFDEPYFERLDALVTVSDKCGDILRERFPKLSGKVRVIHNVVSPALIRTLSEEAADWGGTGQREIKLLTIGRLTRQKGLDYALAACRLLIERYPGLCWYVAGEGEERAALEAEIAGSGLQKHFILLGLRANPYPYMREADIYVQPSRFEGKSIAIDEAKILGKPIVVTDFPTAADQIRDGVNGRIVAMNAAALAEGIVELLEYPERARRFREHLGSEELGTESEIQKLMQLIEAHTA